MERNDKEKVPHQKVILVLSFSRGIASFGFVALSFGQWPSVVNRSERGASTGI